MKTRSVLDVSGLPNYAFGHRSLMWWGTLGFIAIEGTVFVLAAMTYFYLRSKALQWPPGAPPPDLLPGVVNSAILLASLYPNQRAKRAAEDEDLAGVRLWLLVCIAFGVAFNLVRIWEFQALNCRWDQNAYGSIVWTILGLHTLHILTDVADTIVLTAAVFLRPITGMRFSDVSDNSFYWYFVVLSWIPLYAVLYVAPRL
jgi:cytochrome c oxidase subunit 3